MKASTISINVDFQATVDGLHTQMISVIMHVLNFFKNYRPQAHSGLWCGLILPLALILSVVRYSDQISLNYQLTAMSTTVMAIFLLMKILHGIPELIYILALILNCLLFAITGLGLVTTFIISSCIMVLSTGAYSLLLDLFRGFPASFSVGEGLLVIEGLGAFVFSIIANIIIRNVSASTIFAQVMKLLIKNFLFKH
jgi:hypothetical protein